MFLYWIRLPEHTDIFSQGYVGIANNFNQRMFAHRSCAKKSSNEVIYKVIRKYGWENLIKQIVLIGSKDYCAEIEKRLRFQPKIGWNLAIGGYSGGSHLKGIKQSDEHLKKRCAALVGRVSGMFGKKHKDEVKEKCRKANLGKVLSIETKRKISEKKFQKIEINGVIYPSWKSASEQLHIPTGSLAYLLASTKRSGKYAWIKTMSLVM